jgi:hypothetical protein
MDLRLLSAGQVFEGALETGAEKGCRQEQTVTGYLELRQSLSEGPVRPVQHALLPSPSPLKKTLHKAGTVTVSGGVAAVAFFDVATERRRAADLDGPHDAQLL